LEIRMKIGNPSDNPVALAQAAGQAVTADATKPQAAPVAPAGAAPDPSAKVQLSSTAATLLAGGTSADFDAQKVAQMSKAIEDGTFKANPEAIADKLIANAQELLSKNHA
jgi:negative regulator of flagellin synthesis FlgM